MYTHALTHAHTKGVRGKEGEVCARASLGCAHASFSAVVAVSLGHLGAAGSALGSAVGTLDGGSGAGAAAVAADGACEGPEAAALWGGGASLLGTCDGSLLAGAAAGPLPSALGTLLGDGGISLTCTTSGSSASCPNTFLNHARICFHTPSITQQKKKR